ncbi:T-complex protein 1 subunit beta-like protein [Tanacetum coccineum]|uniref:T-complex protein 1 subunit beta-like protein n=1 Tax=Tanacetum coccineum TaxID=301880 RepID=A0ABQ5J7A3_9ASTR
MNETSFRCPTSGGNQSRVVPTYHQDEDDQDAHAIQDDNPSITTLIHVEYSRDDISKTETPIVIEEDETLMVEATTKLHKVQTEDNIIMPEEETSKDSLLKEILTPNRSCGLIMADTSKARHLSTYNKFRNKEKKKHVWSTTIPPDELEVEFFSRRRMMGDQKLGEKKKGKRVDSRLELGRTQENQGITSSEQSVSLYLHPLYGDEVTEEKGELARMASFVGAMAIADLVKTTLGPKGMGKILQDDEVGDGTTSVVVFGLWKISGGSRTHY